MAYYFLTASKDASVYLQQPDQNAGLDEVLEVSKVYYGNIKDVSRALLQFETTNLATSITSGDVSLEEATLIMRETESEELPLDFTIYAYPISQSWEMGKGTRFDNIETAGVTWNYREGDSNLRWVNTIVDGLPVFAGTSTGSFAGRGGVWYSDVYSTQEFTYQSRDINMNVFDIVSDWVSGSKENNGLIIKHLNSVEEDTNDYGILKFFSKETNTIHQPKIRIGWDDSSFTTGSLTELSDSDINVSLSNFKKEYKVNTIPKIKVKGRTLYPIKTFSSTFNYATTNYLPSTTYYQISDYHTNDIIVPFSDYTKVSCDSSGNYFNLNLTNWETNRTYKIEMKVSRDGTDEYFDNDYTFNVIS
jgi:hypothetical protein